MIVWSITISYKGYKFKYGNTGNVDNRVESYLLHKKTNYWGSEAINRRSKRKYLGFTEF